MIIKKIQWVVCGLLLSCNVLALEVAGVKLADTAQVGNVNLQLNGAGIRTKFFFKIYVGALYLPQKQNLADTIIADEHEHRVALHIMHELSSKKLYGAFLFSCMGRACGPPLLPRIVRVSERAATKTVAYAI